MFSVRSSEYGSVIVVMAVLLAFFSRRAANGAAARSATRMFQLGGQLELPESVVPHAFENTRDRAKRVPPGAVEALPAIGAHLNEAGVLEGAQLEGHRSE